MLDTRARKYVQPVFDQLAGGLIKLKMTPTRTTVAAFIVGLTSILALLAERNLLSVALLWLSGLLDVLDGTIARKTGTSSKLGAFLDIVFDRFVELGIIIGLVVVQSSLGTMLVVLTSGIVMSLTIFLTVSSFAENSGEKSFHYQAGVAERTEGFIMFSLMILFADQRLILGYIFAGMVFFTAGQRFFEGIRILRSLGD